jgi:hypothetical protein
MGRVAVVWLTGLPVPLKSIGCRRASEVPTKDKGRRIKEEDDGRTALPFAFFLFPSC